MANGFQGPPAVDFYSQLSGLGDVIAANRAAQAKRDAFAQATMPGADGKIDYGRAILGLAQVDPQSAALFAQRQNHDDTLKQQAIDNARAAARDATTDKHWGADYALRKAANDRSGEDKFLVKEVTDPNTGATTLVRVKTTGAEGVIPTGAAPSAPANPYAYGKQNEAQSKDSGYANRMFDAEQTLRDPKVIAAGTSVKQSAIEGVPLVPDAAKNWAHSPDYQKYDQAQRNMINAILRRESGAAISQSEFDNAYKQYIPRVGDSPEKLVEKQRNRQAAIAGIAGGGGQSYKPPYVFGPNGELVPTGAPAQGATAPTPPKAAPIAAPKPGQLQDGYRYKGGDPAEPASWVKVQ